MPNKDSGPVDSAFVPRTPEQFQKFLNLDKVRDAFALKMGRAFLEWTSCCDAVSIIFDLLTGLDEETSELIFRCIRNDKTQRELTLDIAKMKLRKHANIFGDLEKAIRQLGELAADRNVIAHCSFGLHVDKDWNAEMRPMSDSHAWNAAAETRLDEVIEGLGACGKSLFAIWTTLAELRSVGELNS